ncbi:MAG: hypothetical protein IK088_05095 [Lachnospiraceae bacterium]|nr:hypothetical protein [Lachnospiraceae bacterium]
MSKARDFFEDDLRSIRALSEEEVRYLLSSFRDGDESAMEPLVNGCQERVYQAAKMFTEEDELFMDLVQEGNLSMIAFFRDADPVSGTLSEDLETAIRSGMKRFLEEEAENQKAAEELKTKLNVMDAITMKIAEEENREATPEEIAALMNLSPDDVKYLMHIALTALEKETL